MSHKPDDRNGPGAPPPQAASQTALKNVLISGTDLSWTLGAVHTYAVQKGETVVQKSGRIVGMGVLYPPEPNKFGQVEAQVHIIYEDGYKDIFIVADHLVIRNIHVSPIAVVQGPRLVVPGK